MAKIAVLGSGAWATALANILLTNNHEVYIWGIDHNEINDLKKGYNTKYFNKTKLAALPALATTDLKQIVNAQPTFFVVAVPSRFVCEVIEKVVNLLDYQPYFINVAKGLHPQTNDVLSKNIKKIINKKAKGLVTIIGPSFAKEVMAKKITIVNGLSNNVSCARIVGAIFNNSYFRIIPCGDEIGGELSAALKNVMAIALGIAYAQHTSINTRAAMLAQAASEICKIIKFFGGQAETIANFCGIGDIYLTCTDPKSRNFTLGTKIAKAGITKALAGTKSTVEGYHTAKLIYEIIKQNKMSCPVFMATYKVLYEKVDACNFVQTIMRQIF